jgi:hypothetical protein
LRILENRVLRRMFGPKRAGVTKRWRKLHNEEVPSINLAIKLMTMRWAGNAARMGRTGTCMDYWQ